MLRGATGILAGRDGRDEEASMYVIGGPKGNTKRANSPVVKP